jgi:histidinol-phosphatase
MVEAAHLAGRAALGYFDGTFDVEWKADESPVTVADREAEALLRKLLQESFPKDGFLGEEYGDTPGTSGYRWIIDPIDGTRSFVRGIPIWGTLVGLEYKGELIAGVAEAPALGHTWRALRGDGAHRNDRPIHVSDITDLSQGLLFYSSLSWFVSAGRQDDFLRLVRGTDCQRGFGDFYGHVLVAQGSGEVMVEHGVHAWDVAALKPIVEEAGGRYSTWGGSQSIHEPDVVVSNGKVHDAVLAVLRG